MREKVCFIILLEYRNENNPWKEAVIMLNIFLFFKICLMCRVVENEAHRIFAILFFFNGRLAKIPWGVNCAGM